MTLPRQLTYRVEEGLGNVRLSKDGVFYTLQGEGPLVGTPSLFVRLDTCNLRCKWGDVVCDAWYTSWSPGQLSLPIADLCGELGRKMLVFRCRNVVITGGEPFLQQEPLQELCRSVLVMGGHTTIETNATRYFPTCADLICMSPKLVSSTPFGSKYEDLHERNRLNLEVIKEFMRSSDYYFKFVVDKETDIREILGILEAVGQKIPDHKHVCFMPQGVDEATLKTNGLQVAEWCKKLGVRYSPRLQIDLWGNRPGT